MNCLYNVFAFDLEACNVEYSKYCESYAAGVYHLNNYIGVLLLVQTKKSLLMRDLKFLYLIEKTATLC